MEVDEDDILTQENKCVQEVVKAILILDRSKKPIKLSDISKFLTKNVGRKKLQSIMNTVEEKLKEMGYTLVRLKSSNFDFILTSSIYPLPSMYQVAPENEVADRILLILVLTFIFMKEGPSTNVDILNHLQKLNIFDETTPVHKYFGDVKKKIFTEFVSQLYLEKIVAEKEAESFEVIWGERAQAEVSKKSILEFVCKVGFNGKIEPRHLPSQYKIAMQEEEDLNRGSQDEEMLVE